MEVVFLFITIVLTGTTVYLLWKNHSLKRDIYAFTQKLDESLNDLLNDKKLNSVTYQQDDLWGMVYERLLRLSTMYIHKNAEVHEEKEKIKELLSDISHQTKTPIANLKLYLEILSDENDIDSYPEYLLKMNGQLDKLDFLLQSMVKMSRLETGAIKIQKEKGLISDTLAVAIAAVVPEADKKKICIHVKYDEKLELHHDKKWTGEAIFNVLDNAVKYTEAGGNIYVFVCREAVFTKISIQDTGKGIAVERLGTIFTRFYREPEIHNSEGIGIGLFLARKIITLQDGYIQVDSKIGEGSNFMIYLPN